MEMSAPERSARRVLAGPRRQKDLIPRPWPLVDMMVPSSFLKFVSSSRCSFPSTGSRRFLLFTISIWGHLSFGETVVGNPLLCYISLYYYYSSLSSFALVQSLRKLVLPPISPSTLKLAREAASSYSLLRATRVWSSFAFGRSVMLPLLPYPAVAAARPSTRDNGPNRRGYIEADNGFQSTLL
jgi:hypothetical protein